MALMMATLPTTGLDDLWLWFALVQFPIYTLPMMLGRRVAVLAKGDGRVKPGHDVDH